LKGHVQRPIKGPCSASFQNTTNLNTKNVYPERLVCQQIGIRELKSLIEMASLANNMPLPKLSKGVGYDNWSLQMKALLGSQEV